MRNSLRTLSQTGVVTGRRRDDFPGSLDYELTAVGQELEAVAKVLQRWLSSAPDGPVPLGGVEAKSVIKALIQGWNTGVTRALAARPLSLTELDALIAGVSYPSLERRLGAMFMAGLVERTTGAGRSTPYAVTEWLRLALGPLAAAAHWERRNVAEATSAMSRVDVEAGFLLGIPLLRLPAELSGVCRLAVEVPRGRLAGVTVGVKEGEILTCVTSLEGRADAWASGSAGAWLRAVTEDDSDTLEINGDCQLAAALVEGLHRVLFGVRRRSLGRSRVL